MSAADGFAMRNMPAELLLAMRQKNPLVQCLQTPVSMDITANVLLAAGASPAMVCSEEETPAFLPKAGALYVNMGTLNAVRVGEIAAAIEAATRLKKPWVLDPVACGGTPFRTAQCAIAMRAGPTIVRGNASEIIALAAACGVEVAAAGSEGPRGVDSTAASAAALPAARALARAYGSVVAISGACDIVADALSDRVVSIGGGSELLTKITGVGCALSALVAACLAAAPDMPMEAAVAACVAISTAVVGSTHADPGNLRVHLIARLHTMSASELESSASILVSHIGAASGRLCALPTASEKTAVENVSAGEPALACRMLEDGAAVLTSQVLHHPMMLMLVSSHQKPSAPSAQDKERHNAYALLRTAAKSAFSALIAVASGASSVSASGPQHPGNGAVNGWGQASADALLTQMAEAQKSGRGGDKIAALAVMRMYLTIFDTLRRVMKDGNGVWWEDEEKVRSAATWLQQQLESGKVLESFSGSALLVAEAQAYYNSGILAVMAQADQLEAAVADAQAGPIGEPGGDEEWERARVSLPMMAPEDWEAARALLDSHGVVRPTSLHARVPRVLIVAGSDSSGGAGIQADIKACQANGAFAMTAISALTAQNTTGVQGVLGVSCEFLEQQILSCLSDIRVDVVKTGMLATAEVVERVARAVGRKGLIKWVVDPVMVATSGHELVGGEAVAAIKKHLFPVAHIITPNLPEAALLLKSGPIRGVQAMVDAARQLAAMGPRWVLVKGGHMDGGMCSDVLLEAATDKVTVFEARYVSSQHTHGTGCTLASSIAALLAQGTRTEEAVARAKDYVWDAIRFSAALGLGAGHGPLNHQYITAHWSSPWSDRSLMRSGTPPMHRGKPVDYALYAVTDDAMIAGQGLTLPAAVEAAIRGGVSVVQLRQKDISSSEMLAAAQSLLPVCRRHGVPLIINDRVDIALACDADGVHVGQEDLPCKVVRRMLGPHKIIGVSVKTPQQMAQAERDGADYVGSGAVYPTSTKDSSAIGLAGLALVCRSAALPVVAIGGLNAANCRESLHVGAVGVAVVSAIFKKPDPQAAAQAMAAALRS